jgi:hypothetical protein
MRSLRVALTGSSRSLFVALALGLVGCSEPAADDTPGTGGSAGTGTSAGGMPLASGGAGTSATGGRMNGAGGTSAVAGTGGTSVTGGGTSAAGSGGAVSTGGAGALGGTAGVGPSPGGMGPAAGTGGGMSGSGGEAVGGSAGNAAGSGGAAGAQAGGWAGYAATVENTSADCPVGTLAEPSALPSIPKLPDPFTKLDGTRMTSQSEWRCRRQEILEQAKKYIYGDRPTPDKVSGTVSNTSAAVHVEAMGKSIDFSVKIVLPKTGTAPYPALINVGASGLVLKEQQILDQGVAVIYYNMYDLGKEGQAEASRGKPNPGKFYDLYGGDHSAGLLMAWSWGASRLIDVLQQSGGAIIDTGALAVTGCSRNGKGAFAVGVFDERIALTIPQETSTAGVPVLRYVDILNTERTDHNYFGLNWLSDNFEPFVYVEATKTSNAVKLPIDTHELVASLAPRALLVLDNPHQTQMSAPAGHLATATGVEVFKALGIADHVSYHSNVSDTAHCSYKTEYTDLLLRAIDRFLKHGDSKTGDFIVGNGGEGPVSEWKTWDTPTLTP